MKKASKVLSAAMALTLGLSLVSYGTAKTEQAVAESAAQDAVVQSGGEMGGYLYVHFINAESAESDEQLHFSISPDAKDWYILNNGDPVSSITPSAPLGSQGGIRDPYILRKHDGSGYYIIATDLSIYNINGNWGASQSDGSHNIIVWDTDDLTELGEPRMVEIAAPNATCTWAPEAVWDDEKEAYMVFWSVLANKSWNNNGNWETGMYWTHHVYRCYTTDFVTFTEPEIYIQSEQQTIDASIIKEGDTYYRFTKIETDTGDDIFNANYGSKTIFMEKCKSLSGEWEMVTTYTLDGKHWSKVGGFEGPSIFKLNAKDTNGTDQWCLMLDDYGGAGYTPFITNDIEKGEFTRAADINFDSHGRHGAFMSLTKSEYDALCEKYNIKLEEEEREHKEVFSMNVSGADGDEILEYTAGMATEYGTFTYEAGMNGGKAVRFDGNDYIEIDGSALAGLDGFTVSFAAKFNGVSWVMYAAPDGRALNWNDNGNKEVYVGLIWGDSGYQGITAQRWKNTGGRAPCAQAQVAQGEWKHITVVFGLKKTAIYVNGELIKTQGGPLLTDILGETPTIYLGRAQWGGGEYSDFALDGFKIHNWGMTAEEVKDNYNKVMG